MLFLSFLSPMADGFISSSRLSPRLWSQSLSFERKHQSSKQWPKRPRSRSPLEVVSIYLASFRCKLHCPCRITRTTTYLSSSLDVLLGGSPKNPKSQAPNTKNPRSRIANCGATIFLSLMIGALVWNLDLGVWSFSSHASITTGVPSFTISNNSITSSLRILTQP